MNKTLAVISVCILVAAALVFIVYTNDLQNEVKVITSVSTQEKGKITAVLETFSFKGAVDNSDLIAEVTIKKLVKEIDDPSPKTIFEASISQIFKGPEDLKIIEVLQQGNSEWEFNGNRLFSPNEKYILFLKKAVGEGYDDKNIYWILGEETNIYSIVDGNKVVKNALYDEDLKTIEEDQAVNNLNIISNEEVIKKQVQILNKEKFENMIHEIVSKKNSN